ncbi:MAG: S8 family serine peptidase, partial [Gammaproteobacteria bacterium]|nr:S8 family serine peptidase [Gammaproteobacteria bacterium]
MKNAYPRWIFVVLAALSGCGGGGGSEPSAEPPPPIVEPPVTPPPVTVPSPGNLTGLIVVPPAQHVDGDTNNPEETLRPNNRAMDAQVLPNPFIVSGFVTLDGTGGGDTGSDRFAIFPDWVDYYRVTLNAGQRLRLQIADWLAEERLVNDIDLALYDLQGNLVDESVGLGEFEELVVPASGEYFVGVEVFRGHSNYVLQVSDALAPLTGEQRAPRLSDPIVVGEVVAQIDTTLPTTDMHAQGMLMRSDGMTDDSPVLIQLDAPPLQLARAHSARQQRTQDAGFHISADMAERREYLHRLKQLQATPGIHRAAPNYRRQALTTPNDPLFNQQWHYAQINLTPAWTQSEGEGVIVAVADTGVFLDHDDLRANLIGGYDFISDIANALDGNGIDPNPDDPGDGGRAGESSWHGTHVAGTVAAVTGNGIGIAGVAPRAQIMPIRVLGAFGGTDYDILQGMRYAAGLSNDSGTLPPRRADIINLSLGGPGFNAVAQQVIDAVRAQGVIVIAASGNENTREPSYPASYAGVVSVGAVGRDGGRAPYSNIGPTLDIV